jgi:hypothetical protein
VVAVDIPDTALERARQHALASDDDVAARIEWTQADLLEWAPPEGAFDLVSLQFLHLPADQRAVVYDRCAAAVAVGGVLLIVGHHPDDLQAPVRRPRWPEMYTTAEQLAAALGPGWEIVTAEARPRRVEGQDGAPVTVTDAVLLARRRPPEANHPPDGADTVA